jgi:dolichol kinase
MYLYMVAYVYGNCFFTKYMYLYMVAYIYGDCFSTNIGTDITIMLL